MIIFFEYILIALLCFKLFFLYKLDYWKPQSFILFLISHCKLIFHSSFVLCKVLISFITAKFYFILNFNIAKSYFILHLCTAMSLFYLSLQSFILFIAKSYFIPNFSLQSLISFLICTLKSPYFISHCKVLFYSSFLHRKYLFHS